MNRGSVDSRPEVKAELSSFNEAPIHESGKSDRAPADADPLVRLQ